MFLCLYFFFFASFSFLPIFYNSISFGALNCSLSSLPSYSLIFGGKNKYCLFYFIFLTISFSWFHSGVILLTMHVTRVRKF